MNLLRHNKIFLVALYAAKIQVKSAIPLLQKHPHMPFSLPASPISQREGGNPIAHNYFNYIM